MNLRTPFFRSPFLTVTALLLSVNLLCGFSIFHKKKYETPITKETMQPDKVLYDRAISNIEHGNYLTARLTLNTLINTYDTSEYIAKAKLAVADSWFREGDAHGLAQAEQEYKDFILFYPNMEEAAQSQSKVCDIHLKQMSEPDRDNAEAQRAEDECRQVLVQFPNSKYAKPAEQKLRNVQEILADKEFRTGEYYYKKGALPAAQGRFSFVTRQYPLYSAADQALWEEADTYHKMGDRFEAQEAESLIRLVRDYPASLHTAQAKTRLGELKRPIPEADPAAYARMKYNIEHRTREGIFGRTLSLITGHPDVGSAAKDGAPIMVAVRPGSPVSVPLDTPSGGVVPPGAAVGGGVSDVGISVAGSSSSLDQKNDARISVPSVTGEHKASADASGISTDSTATAAPQAPLPTNRTKKELDEYKKRMDAAAKAQEKAAAAAAKKAKSAKPGTPAVAPATPPATPPANVPAAAQQ